MFYLPWRYEDRSQIQQISGLLPGSDQTVMGWVKWSGIRVTPRKRLPIFEALIEDSSGMIKAIWFNQRYLKELFQKQRRVVLSGMVSQDRYQGFRLQMENPRFEFLEDEHEELIHMGRIVPVYHETAGCSSRQIRNLLRSTLNHHISRIPERLPPDVLEQEALVPFSEALETVHFPKEGTPLEILNGGKSDAHRRLIFDELLLLELGVGIRKKEQRIEKKAFPCQINENALNRLMGLLPFPLTRAQRRVIEEIKADMSNPFPMNRLLQGDVGCGKTIVALMALLIAVESGLQGVLMVPTEILAEQHYLSIRNFLKGFEEQIIFLTSSVKGKEREKSLERIERGDGRLIIGTHSLLQGEVRFSKLGLAVIDEQHKFGVLQRAVLRKKGYHPDLLIMTATPIPRTLALTVYGDLAFSVIDEMPPGRRSIETRVVYPRDRKVAYDLIRRQVEEGRQAYVVVPLVEESEKVDLQAAIQMAEVLGRDIFPFFRVGLLHGRMPAQERGEVMRTFKEGKIQVLVTTTVIEVGIDVSNATVMAIEHAERFGLSQLHQLRGRIGRGSFNSYCLLLPHEPMTPEAKRRLRAMTLFQDGFSIAEEDLAIRGPGEFLGTKQSGIPELKVASLIRDIRILENARRWAEELLKKDSTLSLPEHQELRKALLRRWREKLELMTVG